MTVSEKNTKPSKQEVIAQLAADRQELLELCQHLEVWEWDKPSLCEGWRVRDVVAHVAASQNELWTYIRSGSEHKGNQKIVNKRKEIPTAELLHEFEASVKPNWLTKLVSSMFLWDNWIHQQDVRWVLGENRQRMQNPARLRMILNGPTQRQAKKQAGLKFETTDQDWQAGEGQVVSGPAEALIMALAGRPMALDKLSGPGLPIFKERMKNIKA